MYPKKKMSVKTLALVGVLSAMVFVLSMLSIPIGDVTRIHFGNIMCLLSGMLFGPAIGGVASGLGSMLFDFTNPLYTPEFWITFITKFAMGFAAGYITRHFFKGMHYRARLVVAAAGGSALYVALYLIKSALMDHYVKLLPWAAVWPLTATRAVASAVNGLIAVAGSVLLAMALTPALRAAGLFRQEAGSSAG